MQLDDTWGDLLQQYQMMLYESVGYYGNAIKELEDLGGGCCFMWHCWNVRALPPNTYTNTYSSGIAQFAMKI